MEHPEISDDAYLVIVINPVMDDMYYIHWRTGDRNKAIDSLTTHISNGVKAMDPQAMLLLEILVSTIEGIKNEFPRIAAAIRQMNYEHLKRKNEQEDQRLPGSGEATS